MAPPFLTGNVLFAQDAGVVDVQTIINHIITLATSLVPAWTNPGAGKIVSPADASGRQFTIQFNRIAATNLEMVLTDGNSRSVTRRAQIPVAGTSINYFVSQFHMVLDWLNAGAGEGLAGIMLDESPEVQTSNNMWVVALGTRNNVDGVDNGWLFGAAYVIRNANTFVLLTNGILAPIYNAANNGHSSGFESRTVGGSNIWCPIIQMGDFPTGNVFNIYGKYYNCLNTKDTYNAPGSEISVPIDQANSALFRVLNQPAWAPGGVGFQDRMAVRKT